MWNQPHVIPERTDLHDVTGIGTKIRLDKVAFSIPFLYQKVSDESRIRLENAYYVKSVSWAFN